eukprot:scaffold14669_cov72-Phaeocystis_antarctica.AAC.2
MDACAVARAIVQAVVAADLLAVGTVATVHTHAPRTWCVCSSLKKASSASAAAHAHPRRAFEGHAPRLRAIAASPDPLGASRVLGLDPAASPIHGWIETRAIGRNRPVDGHRCAQAGVPVLAVLRKRCKARTARRRIGRGCLLARRKRDARQQRVERRLVGQVVGHA